MNLFKNLQLHLVLVLGCKFLAIVCEPTKTINRMQTFIYLNLCVTNIS
jgi:hypothetical protein